MTLKKVRVVEQIAATIKAKSGDQNVILDPPDECPRCHEKCQPAMIRGIRLPGSAEVEVCFQCPSAQCGSLFLAFYSPPPGANNQSLRLQRLAPVTFLAEVFPAPVSTTSPAFSEIYNQARQAETLGLGEIAGIGYRKALEFLIKDFCKVQYQEESEAIERLLLGACIDRYVTDPNVKACAKRATWLGNDETHYVRRWAGKDIEDLKRLVKLTANWIESTILTQQYENEMPPGGGG